MITPFPDSCAYPATFLSCSIIPSSALRTTKTTSERSIALRERSTEYFSQLSYTLPRFLIPAVSITTYSSPLCLKSVSIASRVVPAISDAITRSSPKIVLIKLDLPTLGRPIRENLILSSSSSSSSTLKFLQTSSSKSPIPSPWDPEIGNGSPNPNE